jgi:hypothetical protein
MYRVIMLFSLCCGGRAHMFAAGRALTSRRQDRRHQDTRNRSIRKFLMRGSHFAENYFFEEFLRPALAPVLPSNEEVHWSKNLIGGAAALWSTRTAPSSSQACCSEYAEEDMVRLFVLAPFGTSTSNPAPRRTRQDKWSEVMPFEFAIRMRRTMEASSSARFPSRRRTVINAQQDADDLPRLGETAAEYQARLSRTETTARGGDAGTTGPREAKSSAGKAIAMFQPGTPKAGTGHRAEE